MAPTPPPTKPTGNKECAPVVIQPNISDSANRIQIANIIKEALSQLSGKRWPADDHVDDIRGN